MNKNAFKEIMMVLVDAFERREPGAGTFKVWYRHLSSVPGKDLEGIVQRMIRYEDRYPPNVIACVLSYSRGENRNKPEKLPERKEEDVQAAREALGKIGDFLGKKIEVGDGATES